MGMLEKALEGGKFGVTVEMAPPKGYDFTEQMEAAELLKGKVHGVNVTDMQSACLKASSLGLCIKLKQAGLDPIIQVTGRDRSRMGILGDMLSAAAFGIDTMLALTGDHPTVGDCKQSKPVYDLDSVGILHMLTAMEATDKDCGGNPIEGGAPSFYKGAVVTPVYDPLPLQINKLRQKVEAGAQYIQTQGIFDMESLKRFMDEVDKANIHTHIMAGIIPLKAALEVRRLLEGDAQMSIRLGDKQCVFEAAGFELSTKLIEGNYPNYRQVGPASFARSIELPTSVFLTKIETVSQVLSDSSSFIILHFEDNQLKLQASSSEVGEGSDVVEVAFDGEPFEVSFNPAYLADPLRNCDADTVRMKINDPLNPVAIEGGEGFLYVIMPIRKK